MERITDEAELVDVGDAARLLGSSPRAVYDAIEAGDLTARKVGRRLLLSPVDLATFQAAH